MESKKTLYCGPFFGRGPGREAPIAIGGPSPQVSLLSVCPVRGRGQYELARPAALLITSKSCDNSLSIL